MKRSLLLVMIVVASVVTKGCVPTDAESARTTSRSPDGVNEMNLNKGEFANVPLNANVQHAASPPEPDASWRGMVIRAPAVVALDGKSPDGAYAAAPICGYYMLDAATAPSVGSIVLVARDVETQHTYRGEIGEEDASPEEPLPDDIEPRDPASLAGISVEGYFNPNLFRFVNLPRTPATYDVWAEWGEFRSNSVRIQFVLP